MSNDLSTLLSRVQDLNTKVGQVNAQRQERLGAISATLSQVESFVNQLSALGYQVEYKLDDSGYALHPDTRAQIDAVVAQVVEETTAQADRLEAVLSAVEAGDIEKVQSLLGIELPASDVAFELPSAADVKARGIEAEQSVELESSNSSPVDLSSSLEAVGSDLTPPSVDAIITGDPNVEPVLDDALAKVSVGGFESPLAAFSVLGSQSSMVGADTSFGAVVSEVKPLSEPTPDPTPDPVVSEPVSSSVSKPADMDALLDDVLASLNL